MADRIVKVGVIGCGGIANQKHLPSLHKLPNVQLVAFCDIIVEKAEKAAKTYGTPDAKVYEDYKELLKDESIEVVHVCTPNRSHSFITIDALEAGKNVMCATGARKRLTILAVCPLTELTTIHFAPVSTAIAQVACETASRLLRIRNSVVRNHCL